MPQVTHLHVNGRDVQLNADAARSLLSVLRDDLDLTGCKYGCGEGQCGACTVLVDGLPTRSCRMQVGAVGTRSVTTVESLERAGRLHPVQAAFLQIGALQCGYCTSGMILSTVALLQKHPHPTEDQIVEFMDGNICRCGTYPRILAAIRLAAQTLNGAHRDAAAK